VIIVVLLIATMLLARGAGWLGVARLRSWTFCGRLALTVLFLFTGAAHFTHFKHDMAAIIPDPLPKGMWVIYLTGVLEIAGAVGLMIPKLQRLSAICLILLLIAMFPANVNAALNDIPIAGAPPTPLLPRTLMQLLFIGMLWWTSIWKSGKTAS
jgi:uncharacterized membrane protein